MFAEAGYGFIGFILCISVSVNRVSGGVNVICALKGSSVDLLCSAVHPSSNMKWYTAPLNASNNHSAEGFDELHQVTGKSNFSLRIENLSESDAKFYCCKKNTDAKNLCWLNRTELCVADMQVKVIPAKETQKVTLMCSTSCPLTESPAAYVWYKNRNFLYEDWSPWYQELVSSAEAATYSCAVKGYEELRAPEVSVDAVTPNCFNVTYAQGRMCSHQQKSVDGPCSITYPRDLYVHNHKKKDFITLTCASSCLTSGPQTAYRWYWNKELLPNCESQDMTGFSSFDDIISCAIKGHEDLFSDEVCTGSWNCELRRMNYVSRRICALEGSTVNISQKYYKSSNHNIKIWYKIQRRLEVSAKSLTEDGRVKFDDNMLRIDDVRKNDSAEYALLPTPTPINWKDSHLPAVILVVTGLKVTMTPSAVVTEDLTVTLTCTTSCPLTDSTNYIWYMNGQPLPENLNKHLVLDPVIIEHAGNYSCSVLASQNITSAEEKLTVRARGKLPMIMNAVKLAVLALLILTSLVLLCVRKKKSCAKKSDDKLGAGQVDLLYESIALRPMNVAAQAQPAQLQEDIM